MNYKKNRQQLLQRIRHNSDYQGLLLLVGNSFVQASGDQAQPFAQDGSFFYFTGLKESGLALAIIDDEEYLLTPEFSESRIAFEGMPNYQESGIKHVLTMKEGLQKINDHSSKTIATLPPIEAYIEQIDMFVNPARAYVLQQVNKEQYDIRKEVTQMRMIKQPEEVENIRQAIMHTADIFHEITRQLPTFTNEKDIMALASSTAIKKDLPFAYPPIIASGANAVTLHYGKNNQSIQGPLLLDIGLKYDGYAADISRTITAKPTKRQQAVYDAVKRVHAYAVQLLRPGVLLKDYEEEVAAYMKDQLNELGLVGDIRRYYPHRTSHFLGIDTHDAGDYYQPLQAGNVLTVEPGIYIKEENLGIRLEDNILITEGGAENLSADLPLEFCYNKSNVS